VTNDDTLSVDGVLGKKSLGAINDINLNANLLNPIREVQSNFYKTLAEKKPKLQVFLKGWLRRANS
jgi:lysozyme family protein